MLSKLFLGFEDPVVKEESDSDQTSEESLINRVNMITDDSEDSSVPVATGEDSKERDVEAN